MTSSESFRDPAAETADESVAGAAPQGDAPATAGSEGPVDGVAAGGRGDGVAGDELGDALAGDLPEGDPAAAEATAADAAEVDDPATATERALAERTLDLQRLQAEFLNYKRRVDRDRELIVENATYKVLSPIIEVLDTIDRAREHGELEGGLKAVADQLERVVAGLGLTKFGQPGDAFDPTIHEALSHIGEDPDVEVTTAKVVAKSGYKIADRVVRAAQVLVVDPASPTQ